jgi:SAM-dependent methyltransferase
MSQSLAAAKATVYSVPPLRVEDGIPVFSAHDAYNANYAKIAVDHLAAQEPGKDNPFIENPLWEAMERSTRALVEQYVPAGGRILDIGVGLGRVIGPLTQYTRHGIDISMDYLKQTSAKGIDVAYARIEDMPYTDALFDAVIACDVLEHVLDLAQCTRQMLRVLKPGGVLILRVPYREDLEVYLREDLDYEFIHLRNFDMPSLRLHFGKIFGCEYITHQTVAPHLQGAPRLKLRLLEGTSPIRATLKQVPWWNPFHPLALLKWLTLVSEENFVKWIYRLRDKYPNWFNRVAEDVVHGIEINIVFRKKS